jgi:hypothetical protein
MLKMNKQLSQTFLQRRHTEDQQVSKKCSISLTIKNENENYIMFYLTFVRTAIILKLVFFKKLERLCIIIGNAK